MSDDLEFNLRFIEIVQRYPCLYDTTRSDYNNRNRQEKIWTEIGQLLNKSASDCKDRWKNIRGRYVKQLNKFTTFGSAAKPKKPYYLADHLHFLDAFIKSRRSTRHLQTPQSQNTNQVVQDGSYEGENSLHDRSQSSWDEKEISLDLPSSSTKNPTHNAKKIRRTLGKDNSAVINHLDEVEYLPQHVLQNISELDPDMAFLLSVLPDMKRMSENQKRKFKISVLDTAGRILDEMENS